MQTVSLCELGEVVSGSTPKTGVPEFWQGDIPWITPADLSNHDGIYFRGTPKKISKAGFESCSTAMLPVGSILFSSRAPIGHCAVTVYPVCTNQGFKNIVPNKLLDSVYGYFALKFLTPAIVAMGRGATFAEINKELIESVQIPYCDLSEQRRVAGELEQAERLVRTRRYALELTDTVLPAAFLEVFGDPTTNPLGLPVAELGDYLSFVTSGSRGWAEYYSPIGTRFIRSLDVRMNYIAHEDAVFVEPPDGAEADRTRVKPGDVLLTITGSRIGRVAPVPDRLNGAFISQHVAILRLKPGMLPEFLSMFLSLRPGGQRQIARAQYGQTKPGLNLDQIREIRVPVPDIRHQQRFLELTKRVERLSIVQGEALRQAEHLFASLLDRAFSSQPATAQKQSAARP